MIITKFKSGGEIHIPEAFHQNPQEQTKNTKAYTVLAKEYGEKYQLLNVTNQHGIKSPDALNLNTNHLSDVKMPNTTNGKNAIQNSIKEASKQNVQEAYIYLEQKYPMQEIWAGLKSALQKGRASRVETIIIRFANNAIKRYSTSQLRQVFKGRQ
jgi:hypothetical protein